MGKEQPVIPEYDALPIGDLTTRIRSLDQEQLGSLLAYEQSHAGRIQVVEVMEHRLQALRDGTAEPSGGDATAPPPTTDSSTPAEDASKASPQTEGPPINPPSHGDPTNPAQPRR